MRTYKISRFAHSPDGTFGRFTKADGTILFDVLEEEWKDNERNESCIPAGRYVCRRTIYFRHGHETFEITGVPHRSRILFHVGNTEEDTDGCVLVGQGFGMLEVTDEETGERRDKIGVYNSRVSFRLFMEMLDGVDEFELIVEDPEWSI